MSYNPFPDEKGTERFLQCVHNAAFSLRGYNPFPDEKGTESKRCATSTVLTNVTRVTIHSPTKRGLKVFSNECMGACLQSGVTIHSPTKRGLKDMTIGSHPRGYKFSSCYNPFPDEKGTESGITGTLGRHPSGFFSVTIHSPTKRGLKVIPELLFLPHRVMSMWLQSIPRRKGD